MKEHSSIGRTVALVLAMVCALALFRGWHLGADPALELSFSTGIYTDPPQYTQFARQYVETGDLNPYDDYRFIFFIKSSMTALSLLFFKLFGVSLTVSHLAGLFYSLGALLLFAVFVKRMADIPTALVFLLLAGVNYNLTAYGRFPFLEHAMTFWGFAALACITSGKHPIWHILGGACLGVAILFGKVLGLIFLFPFACFYILHMFAPDLADMNRRWLRSSLFVAGFLVIAGVWYVQAYVPYFSQVSGYLQEQSVSLYGMPEGLESPDRFLYKLVTFGGSSNLLERMPGEAILAAIFLMVLSLGIVRRRERASAAIRPTPSQVFMAAMIVAFFGSLMIWNYRPLRYQLILIYPMCGAAALMLRAFWTGFHSQEFARPPWSLAAISYPVVLVVVYHLYGALLRWWGSIEYYSTIRYHALGLAAVVSILIVALVPSMRKVNFAALRPVIRIGAVIVVIASVSLGLVEYGSWAGRPTYSARDASRDIGTLLGAGAVISGPYGPLLTLDNGVGALIHMFGVSSADPNLFRKYPVTHLAVDEQNRDRAREDYPEIMDKAMLVSSYRIGRKKVWLYNIAGLTGNPRSDAYVRSVYEEAVEAMTRNDRVIARLKLGTYLHVFPENISGHILLARLNQDAGSWSEAEFSLKKAVEFSPTSYVLYVKLADFYRDRFVQFGEPADREEGMRLYLHANHLAPSAVDLSIKYRELRDDQSWNLKDTTLSSLPSLRR
jgi:4-amino-4-deoxy-L-arabinose transferase-like glycosyltransferase